MASLCEKPGGPNNELTFVYGHDTKKFRLRAVSGEKDIYSKFISKPLAKKISCAQLFLATLICTLQVVTCSIVVGQYYYDDTAGMGVGIWSSVIVALTSIQTMWALKNARYWKLHLSFALHIFCMLATIMLLINELCGTIPGIRRRLSNVLYPDRFSVEHGTSADKVSVSMLTISLVINSVMATGGLVQLLASFIMTLMTGRAICCGQSKVHGKVFELDIAGSENADGMAVFRRALQNMTRTNSQSEQGDVQGKDVSKTISAPPSYSDSLNRVV